MQILFRFSFPWQLFLARGVLGSGGCEVEEAGRKLPECVDVPSFMLANFPSGVWDQEIRNKDMKGRTQWPFARILCIWNL